MAATPIVPEEARLVVHETQQENAEYEKYLATLIALNGTDLAQAGRLGQRRIQWVKELDTRASMRIIEVQTRLAPTKKKLHEAWREFCRLEDDLTAPAKAIRDKTRSLIGQFQLEVNRQAEVEAQRLREEQRRAEEEQRRAQEEEAARIRAMAEKLAAEGETAEAEEKIIEAEFVASQPIVPTAVTAQQVAPPKVDSGKIVYFRRVLNWQLFLNYFLKLPSHLVTVEARADDTNETTLEALGISIRINFSVAWKAKDAGADIPGIVVRKSYESRQTRSRR